MAFGYHQTVCRSMTLRYTAHLKIYTFTANNKGMIDHQQDQEALLSVMIRAGRGGKPRPTPSSA